jgi:hypothetical protein
MGIYIIFNPTAAENASSATHETFLQSRSYFRT